MEPAGPALIITYCQAFLPLAGWLPGAQGQYLYMLSEMPGGEDVA